MPEITLAEIAWAFFKWVHIGCSAVWVGGNLFFGFVIRPLQRDTAVGAGTALMAARYRDIIGVVIVGLLLSGVYLMLARLLTASVGLLWLLILGVKLCLVVWMVYIYWNQRQSEKLPDSPNWRRWLSQLIGYDALLGLGIVVLLLSSLLERAAEN